MRIIKRRSTEVDHDIWLLLDQLVHRGETIHLISFHIPYIFTNSYCQTLAFERNYIPVKGWFEVAVFIKNIIIGQQGFIDHLLHLAFVNKVCTIEQVFALWYRIAAGRTYQYRNILCCGADTVNTIFAGVDKIFELQEVARRVATDSQFGEDDKLTTYSCSLFYGLQYPGSVVFKVTDNIVLLGQKYLHQIKNQL
ncbi:hypothetical protein D3C80_1289790 [compost metagenome]